MLSKQKTKKLFNSTYIKTYTKIMTDIRNSKEFTVNVKVKAVREGYNKYLKIYLPENNILKKAYLKYDLNTKRRPNHKDGSVEMYRDVNGLCHHDGHDTFTATLIYSHIGYILEDRKCTKCGKYQPTNLFSLFSNKKEINRGKKYSDNKKKNQVDKNKDNKKSFKTVDIKKKAK